MLSQTRAQAFMHFAMYSRLYIPELRCQMDLPSSVMQTEESGKGRYKAKVESLGNKS